MLKKKKISHRVSFLNGKALLEILSWLRMEGEGGIWDLVQGIDLLPSMQQALGTIPRNKRGVMVHIYIPVISVFQRQTGDPEFKAIIGCVTNSSPVWAT